jgi:hypothetical protein
MARGFFPSSAIKTDSLARPYMIGCFDLERLAKNAVVSAAGGAAGREVFDRIKSADL